jgi:hypothetical protein
MPKRLPHFLTLLAGLLICYCFLAAKAPMAAKQYDYVTITQVGDELRIASAPNHYEVLRDKTIKDGYNGNFSPLLTMVNEYEAQGYELFENTMSSYGATGALHNYVLLRRPKP